jgi:outer membrane biogenesis lipoprotein LolB
MDARFLRFFIEPQKEWDGSMIFHRGSMRSVHIPVDPCRSQASSRAWRAAWASLFLILLLSAACAHAPSFDLDGTPAHSPAEVIGRINRNALQINSLSADVRLNSAHIPQSRLARADLLYARPGMYRVQFKTLFGNTMAAFTVRQNQAELYLPMSNRLYQGDLTVEEIRDLVGIELPAADLLETLSGIFSLPTAEQLSEYRRIGGDHLLVFPWGRGRREIRVAPDGYRVLEDRFLDARGGVVVEKTFEGYRMIDGVLLPERVRAVIPEREEDVEVWFSHQTVDVPWRAEDFQLNLPDGVERIPWGGEYR